MYLRIGFSKKIHLNLRIMKYITRINEVSIMANKSSRSYLAMIGGLVAVLGVGLSIFIKELGWWNFLTVINNEVTDNAFFSAFFGEGNANYFGDTFTLLLPGIIAGVGGVLCLTGNRFLSLIGSVIVIVGIVIFLVLLGDSDAAALADFLGTNIFWDKAGITIGDAFTGFRWRLGYGMFITAGGGILALIGGITASKK